MNYTAQIFWHNGNGLLVFYVKMILYCRENCNMAYARVEKEKKSESKSFAIERFRITKPQKHKSNPSLPYHANTCMFTYTHHTTPLYACFACAVCIQQIKSGNNNNRIIVIMYHTCRCVCTSLLYCRSISYDLCISVDSDGCLVA